jgi:hypothetical protein
LILSSNKRSTWNIYKKLPWLTRSLRFGTGGKAVYRGSAFSGLAIGVSSRV